MKDDWKDNQLHTDSEEPARRWFVRVSPKDGKRETAVEMWRWLQSMGVVTDQVERINDHSFKVWVDDRSVGELIKKALEERSGK